MRQITTHRTLRTIKKTNSDGSVVEFPDESKKELNDFIRVDALTESKGEVGYLFHIFKHGEWQKAGRIDFQKGPPKETMIDGDGNKIERENMNGVSVEALLAVVLDQFELERKRQEASGTVINGNRAMAEKVIIEAMRWLQGRLEMVPNKEVKKSKSKKK